MNVTKVEGVPGGHGAIETVTCSDFFYACLLNKISEIHFTAPLGTYKIGDKVEVSIGE